MVCDENKRIAVYPRNGSETRLHGLFSAAAGGHVNLDDRKNDDQPMLDILHNALLRELNEEFQHLPTPDAISLLGVINEDESAVGRVHLGVVYRVNLKSAAEVVAGTELKGLRWCSLKEAAGLNLELWSRLALSLLDS
jgi:predicted NUDIX family phosphoesterase